MSRKPSACNITHGLAQLGGGAKKDGGEGMLGGMQSIFAQGVQYGRQQTLEENQLAKQIGRNKNR